MNDYDNKNYLETENFIYKNEPKEKEGEEGFEDNHAVEEKKSGLTLFTRLCDMLRINKKIMKD